MASIIAKLRFITDQPGDYENKRVERKVKKIRRKFTKYLYDPNPPQHIIDELAPLADEIYIDNEEVVRMYEP